MVVYKHLTMEKALDNDDIIPSDTIDSKDDARIKPGD